MTYCKREWLNAPDSPSTGSVVAYDGKAKDSDGEYRSTFLQISDCYAKVKLHKSSYDNMDDFIDKMKKLRTTIDEFIAHLEENKEETK